MIEKINTKFDYKKVEDINMIKTSLFLFLSLIGVKFISFFRDILLARNFGVSNETDAFFVSLALINVFSVLITSPLAASYIPIASGLYLKEDQKKFKEFLGISYVFSFVAGLALLIFQYFFLSLIINILAPGFSNETFTLVYNLTLVQLPIIVLSILRGVNNGNLQMINKFNLVQYFNALGIFFVVIYLLIFGEKSKILHIAFVFTIGNFISILLSSIYLKKADIKPIFNVNFKMKEFISLLKMMLIFSLATVIREVNVVFDKAIGSMLPVGSITMMSYASKLTITEVGLISVVVSTVAYSQISKYIIVKRKNETKKYLILAINLVNTVVFPLAFITIVFRYEIIQLLFGRGEFSYYNIKETADIMMFYAFGMIGFGIQDVLTRVFHAMKVAKYTVYSSLLLVILNVSLSLSLYKSFGARGVAFATSLSVLITIIPLIIICHKKFIDLNNSGLFKSTVFIIFSTLFSTLLGFLIYKNLISKMNLILVFQLLVTFIIIFAFYLLFGYISKNEIIYSSIKNLIFKKEEID
jgi:putative peptidoglycan lipid II flippase